MTRIGIRMMALLSGALITISANSAAPGQLEVAMRAAIETETVEGDLKSAIDQYRKIAEAGDRSLAARALIRMADCYQKLGDDESRKIFERVIRDYGDQKDAVLTARARLGGGSTRDAVRGDRAIWTGPNVDLFGRVSPDGRYITYVDWEQTGNLMVHDVFANSDRPLTSNKTWGDSGGEALWSTVSHDGKQVAYAWLDYGKGKPTKWVLNVAPLLGNGSSRHREVLGLSHEDVRFLNPYDWSPDGRWIALVISRNDGSGQIALASVADGSLRVLKPIDWEGVPRIFFSRDSKYLAYDLRADGSDQRDVFVMAIDGPREVPVVVHPANESVMGWSPDGSLLLFTSDRLGSIGLWGVPVANGQPHGTTELLKPDIGSGFSLGVTTAGTLLVFKSISSRDIRIAPIDLAAGQLAGPPRSFAVGFLADPAPPDWSPDGKYLAYTACDRHCLAIRSVETGQVHRLPQRLQFPGGARWSPDSRSIVVAGRDRQGRNGIFRVDARTGDVTTIALGPRPGDGPGASPVWSADGKRIYYVRDGLVERDLASGAERQLLKQPLNGALASPDGRWVLSTSLDASTKAATLVIVPTEGGAARELLQLKSPEIFGGPRTRAWTPDSRSAIVAKGTASHMELWLVPINGESPRKLDIDIASWSRGARSARALGFGLSPDGRQIAFADGKSAAEVWALENFLPATAGTTKR